MVGCFRFAVSCENFLGSFATTPRLGGRLNSFHSNHENRGIEGKT